MQATDRPSEEDITGRPGGKPGSRKLNVLFLCTGNSCRSQMAEGWARCLRGGVIEAYSAGVSPHGMNRLAARAMAEAGVDITEAAGYRSKHVDELLGVPFDYVITVCGHAHETCPVFPGRAKVVHVGFDDPPALAKGATTDDEAMPHYRRVRDEIRRFIERFEETVGQAETVGRAAQNRA
jgi:arsenate reductase